MKSTIINYYETATRNKIVIIPVICAVLMIVILVLGSEIIPQALIVKGDSFLKLKEWDKAFQEYNKTIELYPQLSMAYCGRGIVSYEKGDYESAIEDFTRAIGLNQKNAFAYSYRGTVYFMKAISRNPFLESPTERRYRDYYEQDLAIEKQLDPGGYNASFNDRVKQMIGSNSIKLQELILNVVVIGVVIVVVVVGIITVGTRLKKNHAKEKASKIDAAITKLEQSDSLVLNAKVTVDGSRITVKNNNSYSWSSVEMHINEGFQNTYSLKCGIMESGRTYTFDIKEFANIEGIRFNIGERKIIKITISGRIPSGVLYEEVRTFN